MMNIKQVKTILVSFSFVLLFSALAVFTGGCTPTRSEYYSGLHQRRRDSYKRWRDDVEEEHAPNLEGELMLEDALNFALSHNPSLLAALQMKQEGRGRVVEAYSAALPQVTLSGTYTRLDYRPMSFDIDEQTGQPDFSEGDRDRYSAALDITQPLYQGGSIPVALRAARLYAYLSEEAVRGVVEQTVFSTANAYYSALLAQHLVEVEEAALESARAHLEAARARRAEGLARDYDVLRAEVEGSNIEASLIEQRQEKDAAFTALMRAMGASQKSDVQLAEDWVETEFSAPSFAESVETAFRNRPDLARATIEADISQEAVAEVGSRYLPRLSAFYNHAHERDDGSWDDEWRAGLRLNWTIFDGLAREGAMIQKRAERRRKEILLGDAEQQAIKEVRDALLEVESANQMVQSQRMNIRRAMETQRLVEEGYREGVNTEIELLDARTALTRARGLYFRALYRQETARLSFKMATGRLASDTDKSGEE